MLKRSDGQHLLTKEIYEQARRGEDIPCDKKFYDGDSYIFIHRNKYGWARYWIKGDGDPDNELGFVKYGTIELIRTMCMPNDQPLPSEEEEGDKVYLPLDAINKRLDAIEEALKVLKEFISKPAHPPGGPFWFGHPNDPYRMQKV